MMLNYFYGQLWYNTKEDRVCPFECQPDKTNKMRCFWQGMVPLIYRTARHHRSKAHSPHGGIHVNKQKVGKFGSVDSPYIVIERSGSRQVARKLYLSQSVYSVIYISYLVISQILGVKPLYYCKALFFHVLAQICIRGVLIFALSQCGRFFSFLLLAKMLRNL